MRAANDPNRGSFEYETTDNPAAEKLTVLGLAILKDAREIEVCLSNGARVKVYGAYGGFMQYGAGDGTTESREAYAKTHPIAQRWAKWLNTGKGAPKPAARYTEYQDLHAYERDMSAALASN